MPPSEMTAVSLVPPPMSMTMLPSRLVDRQVGTDRRRHRLLDELRIAAPARRAASSTARRSTSVIADGTQMTTFGPLKPRDADSLQEQRIIRSVMSKSVIAPPRSGRTATMYPGVRPIICQALPERRAPRPSAG